MKSTVESFDELIGLSFSYLYNFSSSLHFALAHIHEHFSAKAFHSKIEILFHIRMCKPRVRPAQVVPRLFQIDVAVPTALSLRSHCAL